MDKMINSNTYYFYGDEVGKVKTEEGGVMMRKGVWEEGS